MPDNHSVAVDSAGLSHHHTLLVEKSTAYAQGLAVVRISKHPAAASLFLVIVCIKMTLPTSAQY